MCWGEDNETSDPIPGNWGTRRSWRTNGKKKKKETGSGPAAQLYWITRSPPTTSRNPTVSLFFQPLAHMRELIIYLYYYIYITPVDRVSKTNSLTIWSLLVVGGDWMIQGSWVVSFCFSLFRFQFCSSSPMIASIARDGVGFFILYTSIPFFFFNLLTCLSFSSLSLAGFRFLNYK